ncbi:MAG TPA: 4Fe-4S dicluster domain-containing protein, partial [Sphingomonadales bacterium]|nr:4Fe-4S dicluster domain-containing protein [Sphingomonadales bacterium]
ELSEYPKAFRRSWVWKDLYKARNARPALRKFGNFFGTLYGGLDLWLHSLGLGFLFPWTLGNHADHSATGKAADYAPIAYPKPDGIVTFDRLSSVFVSNTNHEEDQPCHLKLKDASIPVAVNLKEYAAPEQRYCPAAVYEILRDAEGKNPYLQINAQNCVHCKTCDIKDVTQNIVWTPPEGGGGPNYPNM